jgi:multidrug efflux pump subunit AcrB
MTFFRRLIRNTVLTDMMAVIIVVMGVVAFLRMPREAYPSITFNWVYILATYPGATPDEIEREVIREIESAIEEIDGIKTITSLANEHVGQLSVRFETMPRAEYQRHLQDLQREVDAIRDQLPDGVERIDYFDLDTSTFEPLVHLALAGDYPESRLKSWMDDLRREILDVDGVARADLIGARDRRIWVDVDAARLNAAGLPLSSLVDALRAQNFDLPAGTYEVGDYAYLVQTRGEAASIADLESVIVHPSPSGAHLRIRDLAQVRGGFAPRITRSWQDATPAFALLVTRSASANALEVLDEVHRVATGYAALHLPSDVSIRITGDTTRGIRGILRTLYRNAGFGLLLVILTLLLFLRARNALFAAFGIVVAFAGTFLLLDLMGESLNGNSLFGLVLVLGMIVDDAIVVLENLYRHIERGRSPAAAVVDGMSEVAMPVVSSSLTTIAGFLPLMLLPGLMGEFLKVVPLVVSLALAVSLFEALVILPGHIANWGRAPASDAGPSFGSRIIFAITPSYLRTLGFCFNHRYWIAVASMVLPIFSMVVLGLKIRDADLFSGEESGLFWVQVWAPEGTTLDATSESIRRLQEILLDSIAPEERSAVLATAGLVRTETDWIWRSSVGEIFVELVPRAERDRSMRAITTELRRSLMGVAGLKTIKIWEKSDAPPAGSPVEFKIKGPYLDELERLARLFERELAQLPGVVDIDDNLDPGKQVLEIRLRPDVAGLVALDDAALATFVHAALAGETATTFQQGDESIDVVVHLADQYRREIDDILALRVPTRLGGTVPLGDVATVEIVAGLSGISRFNGQRAVTMSAGIAPGGLSAGAVAAWVETRFLELAPDYPGYSIDFGGELQEFNEALHGIGRLALFGVLLIYLILGAQFRSFTQPLIILYTIPIAMAGAALSLTFSGDPLTITTLYGFVALAGVVVNDSLVLVDFINQNRSHGASLRVAVLEAGRTRLRPIWLTTLTTIFGLAPLIVGLGGQSSVWGPLAKTIVWGLTVATALTLLVIPALYAVLDDVARRLHWGRFYGHQLDLE